MYTPKSLKFFLLSVISSIFIVVGCGGGAPTYTVGGNVDGLTQDTLSLNLNNTEGQVDLKAGTKSFAFDTKLVEGNSYHVSVVSQPTNLYCQIPNPTGVVGSANVNMDVHCGPEQHAIGGILTGLRAGESITLQNNSADDLVITENGNFVFPKRVAYGQSYRVAVTEKTGSYDCTVTNSLGAADTDITNIQVNCIPTVSVGTRVIAGMDAGESISLELRQIGEDGIVRVVDTATATATTATTTDNPLIIGFTKTIAESSTYSVAVDTPPPNKVCTVGSNVNTVFDISCQLSQYSLKIDLIGLAAGNQIEIRDAGDGSATPVTVATLTADVTGYVVYNTNKVYNSAYDMSIVLTATSQDQECIFIEPDSNSVWNSPKGVFINDILLKAKCANKVVVGGNLTVDANIPNPATYSLTIKNENTAEEKVVPLAVGTTLTTEFLFDGSFQKMLVGAPYNFSFTTNSTNIACAFDANGGQGTIPGATTSIKLVTITCGPSQYTLGGIIRGLDNGSTITLTNTGTGQSQTFTGDGFNPMEFTFTHRIAYGQAYNVIVSNGQDNKGKGCTIENNTGFGTSQGNVVNIEVSCEPVTLAFVMTSPLADELVKIDLYAGASFGSPYLGSLFMSGTDKAEYVNPEFQLKPNTQYVLNITRASPDPAPRLKCVIEVLASRAVYEVGAQPVYYTTTAKGQIGFYIFCGV